MVAMTLGLLLMLAVGTMFLATQRSHRENRLVAEMQLNARFALQTLSHDLAMAGFVGGLTDPTTLHGVYVGCDPKTKTGNKNTWLPLEFRNNVGNANQVDGTCLAGEDIATLTDIDGVAHGTDVVIIHRTAGKPVFRYRQNQNNQTPDLRFNAIYLRSNFTVGTLCINGSSSNPCVGSHAPYAWPMAFWEYQTFVYFIQEGDGTPSLCRRYLTVVSKNPVWKTQCVADGVADLQLSFGIDTNGDGIANRYMTAPDAGELANAVTVRVQLLMRAPHPYPHHTNNNCYLLQATAAKDPGKDCFNDHYYRRVVQTTVLLRNLR